MNLRVKRWGGIMNVAMIGTLTTYVILLNLRYIPSILDNGIKNELI